MDDFRAHLVVRGNVPFLLNRVSGVHQPFHEWVVLERGGLHVQVLVARNRVLVLCRTNVTVRDVWTALLRLSRESSGSK